MSRRTAVFLAAAMAAASPLAAQHDHHTMTAAPPSPAVPMPGMPDMSAVPEMSPAPTAPVAPTTTLADLEARAGRSNPALLQVDKAVAASDPSRLGGAPLPNPIIGYTADDVPLRGGAGSGLHGVFVSQEIPLGGKLRADREVEARELGAARQRALGARTRLLTEIRLLYARGLSAQHRVEARERLAAVTLEAVEVTAQLFNTGAADHPDRIAIENEAALAAADLSAARSELGQIKEALRGAVGDPALTEADLARLGGEFENGPPLLERDRWLQRLLAESPGMADAQAVEAQAQARLARAKAVATPDLSLDAGVRERRGGSGSGEREGFADVGIRVPLWNRNRAAIAAAEAATAQASLAVLSGRLDLQRRFATVYARYDQAMERVRAYRSGVLDRARKAHELYLGQYSQMMAAYPQVLVALRTRIQLEEDYGRALENAWIAATEIQGLLTASGGGEGPASEGAMAGH